MVLNSSKPIPQIIMSYMSLEIPVNRFISSELINPIVLLHHPWNMDLQLIIYMYVDNAQIVLH